MITIAPSLLLNLAEHSNIMFIQSSINTEDRMNNESLFEVLIFQSLYAMNIYKIKITPTEHERFVSEMYHYLRQWAKATNVFDKIPEDFSDFIFKRFEIFKEEINTNARTLKTKTAYCFYVKPLALECEDCKDLHQIKLMEFKINALLKLIEGTVKWYTDILPDLQKLVKEGREGEIMNGDISPV